MAVISTGQLSMTGAPTYIGSTYTGYYSVNVDLSELEYDTTYAVQGSGRFNNGTSGTGTNYAFDTKWVASENGEIPITFNATSSGKVEVTKTNLKFTVPIKRTQSDRSMSLTCTLTFEKKVYNKVVYGEETLIDLTETTATADKILTGYGAFGKDGVWMDGTATSGSGSAISVVDTTDTHGGTIRTITAVDISDTTAVANDVAQGKYFYTADGTKTEGTSTGGGGGLEYEEGTWTPSEDIARGQINFTETHSEPPMYVAVSDSTGTAISTTATNVCCAFVDFYRLTGSSTDMGASTPRYGLATYTYRGSSTNTSQDVNAITTTSDSSSASSVYDSRYWATPTSFYPYSNSNSRYWKAGRTYKWIAIWAPTT